MNPKAVSILLHRHSRFINILGTSVALFIDFNKPAPDIFGPQLPSELLYQTNSMRGWHEKTRLQFGATKAVVATAAFVLSSYC